MDFLELLKSQKIDLAQIFKAYKIDELKENLNNIVSSSEGYQTLKNNPQAYNHFFNILSQIFLIEQNRQQNLVSADTERVVLSIKFNKGFEKKIKELIDDPTVTQFSR